MTGLVAPSGECLVMAAEVIDGATPDEVILRTPTLHRGECDDALTTLDDRFPEVPIDGFSITQRGELTIMRARLEDGDPFERELPPIGRINFSGLIRLGDPGLDFRRPSVLLSVGCEASIKEGAIHAGEDDRLGTIEVAYPPRSPFVKAKFYFGQVIVRAEYQPEA